MDFPDSPRGQAPVLHPLADRCAAPPVVKTHHFTDECYRASPVLRPEGEVATLGTHTSRGVLSHVGTSHGARPQRVCRPLRTITRHTSAARRLRRKFSSACWPCWTNSRRCGGSNAVKKRTRLAGREGRPSSQKGSPLLVVAAHDNAAARPLRRRRARVSPPSCPSQCSPTALCARLPLGTQGNSRVLFLLLSRKASTRAADYDTELFPVMSHIRSCSEGWRRSQRSDTLRAATCPNGKRITWPPTGRPRYQRAINACVHPAHP